VLIREKHRFSTGAEKTLFFFKKKNIAAMGFCRHNANHPMDGWLIVNFPDRAGQISAGWEPKKSRMDERWQPMDGCCAKVAQGGQGACSWTVIDRTRCK